MRVWEYYYKEQEKIKKITIDDTPQNQKIQFKNRLISSPICINTGAGGNESFDFGNFTPGAGYFTDINADVVTKQIKLFGRKLTRQRSGDPEEWVKGFIDFSFSCTLAGKSYHLPFHKSLTENLDRRSVV